MRVTPLIQSYGVRESNVFSVTVGESNGLGALIAGRTRRVYGAVRPCGGAGRLFRSGKKILAKSNKFDLPYYFLSAGWRVRAAVLLSIGEEVAIVKSAELPIHDLRMALRAVGDCRDVGHDPIAWNFRIACFLKDRFRSVLTTAFTHSIEHNGVSTAQGVLCTLWADNRLHARWLKFIQDHGYRRYLSVQRFAEKGAQTPNTFIRQDLISDREWRTSDERADRLSLKQDELMLSVQPIDGKLSHVFSINRANGDEPFTKRERGLVRLVHEELGVLFGSRLSLTMETETFPTDLSPRLQAVLICLLSGESEKQIASRLGLSPHTVHEYVSKLYRELKVHSRGELMTFAYRRGWVRQDIPVSP